MSKEIEDTRRHKRIKLEIGRRTKELTEMLQGEGWHFVFAIHRPEADLYGISSWGSARTLSKGMGLLNGAVHDLMIRQIDTQAAKIKELDSNWEGA